MPATVRIDDVVLMEGSAGNTSYRVTVSLSEALTTSVSVDFRTPRGIGTAVSGEDFTAVLGTLNFTPGARTQTILINVIEDRVAERQEAVAIELLNLTGNAVFESGASVQYGHLRILNDDGGIGGHEILLRNGIGDLLTWDVTKASSAADNFGFSVLLNFGDSGTTVKTTGDFNFDGRQDVLFRLANGSYLTWDIGGGASGFTVLPPIGADTEVLAVGNFRGDGADDLLLRDGLVYRFYDIKGASATPGLTLQAGWQYGGVGNLNASGRDEIIFRDPDGNYYSWDTISFNRLMRPEGAASNWRIEAVGNFTGTTAEDILFLNTASSKLFYWDPALHASRGNGFVEFVTVQPTQSIFGVADLDGDGRDNIIFNNGDGNYFYWNPAANSGRGEFVFLGGSLSAVAVQGFGDFM